MRGLPRHLLSPRRGPAAAAAAALLMAACRGAGEEDRWRYGRILHEEDPSVRSRDDARRRYRELAARAEITLGDAYRMALHRSETLAIGGEELVRLQARYEQARAALLPAVSFKGSLVLQEATAGGGTSSLQRSFTQEKRGQYQFYGRWPLFLGLREIHALRQQEALAGARERELRHARLLLGADVAEAFYGVLQAERELATTEASLRLAEERREELVQRHRVGISRRSEVLALEAEVASLGAQRERLRGLLAVSWEVLQFLTGGEARPVLRDTLPDPDGAPPLEDCVARALERREDLRALECREAAAEEAVGVARAGYLPAALLEADGYTHREGISADIDWDVLLSFEIPIFDGLGTPARIREARADRRAAALARERLRRDIELSVRRAHADLEASVAVRASLEKVVESARENYEIVQAEYRRGLATNVEVLSVFNTLQQARLEHDRARIQAKLALLRLEIQAGALPEGIR